MKNVLKAVGYTLYFVLAQSFISMLTGLLLVVLCGAESSAEAEKLIIDNMLSLALFADILIVVFLMLFFRIRKKKFADEIVLKKTEAKSFALPCLMLFFYSAAFSLLTYDLQFANSLQIIQSRDCLSDIFPGLGLIVQVLALLIFAPAAEEIVFRGLVLTRLQGSLPDAAAVIVSGVLFGLIHLMAGGAVLAAGAAVTGCLCGLAFVRTKSLLPAIAAHAAANLPDFMIPGEIPGEVRYALAAAFAAAAGICVFFVCKQDHGKNAGC